MFSSTFRCSPSKRHIPFPRVHNYTGLHDLQKALDDDALQELNVTAFVFCKLKKRGTRRCEQFLEVLFASVKQFQARLVDEIGLRTE